MESCLETLPSGIWKIVKYGYKPMKSGPQNLDEVKTHENNKKDRAKIINYLRDTILSRVTRIKEAKEIWDKLSFAYEGDLETK